MNVIYVIKNAEDTRMLNSQIEIRPLKQVMKTAVQGITMGFSAAKPGMNGEEIESVVRNWLHNNGSDLLHILEVKYGKMISPALELQNEIQDGDFLSIDLTGWVNSIAFDLKRITIVGQPTPHQKDYLDHLIEATNWMIEAIVPGRIMTLYPAESRGRLITPIAYEIDADNRRAPKIIAREQFNLPVGMVLCIAPTIKSPEFGTMAHSEMIVLAEEGVEILS
jgi:Xaa-Pro aminopeptidase